MLFKLKKGQIMKAIMSLFSILFAIMLIGCSESQNFSGHSPSQMVNVPGYEFLSDIKVALIAEEKWDKPFISMHKWSDKSGFFTKAKIEEYQKRHPDDILYVGNRQRVMGDNLVIIITRASHLDSRYTSANTKLEAID